MLTKHPVQPDNLISDNCETTMHLSNISQCAIRNRNVHISVLNGVLWDMGLAYCGIYEFGLLCCGTSHGNPMTWDPLSIVGALWGESIGDTWISSKGKLCVSLMFPLLLCYATQMAVKQSGYQLLKGHDDYATRLQRLHQIFTVPNKHTFNWSMIALDKRYFLKLWGCWY